MLPNHSRPTHVRCYSVFQLLWVNIFLVKCFLRYREVGNFKEQIIKNMGRLEITDHARADSVKRYAKMEVARKKRIDEPENNTDLKNPLVVWQ